MARDDAQRRPVDAPGQEAPQAPSVTAAAARAATAKMAASVAMQRMLAPDDQKALVARSLPALDAEVVPLLIDAVPSCTRAAGPAFGTAAFETLLDRTTQSTARQDMQTHVLFDGTTSFAERARLLAGARSSILLETFIFADDATGTQTAQLLIAAAKRGVQVKVIYDDVGSWSTPSALFDSMRAAGVEVRAYNRPVNSKILDVNHRNHAKSLVVDGQDAIMGGMNIGDEYAFGGSSKVISHRQAGHQEGWRDVDVAFAGSAVADAQHHFFTDWATSGAPAPKADVDRAKGTTPVGTGTQSVRVIEHRPEENGDSNTMNAYIAAVNASVQSIEIENAYFVPPAPVLEALVVAAQRGVKIRIRTNSTKSSDNTMDVEAAHHYYPQLLAVGVEIYEQDSQMLHAKTATFDGRYTLIGSVNLNGRSDGRDAETLVAISDQKTAAQMEARFDGDLAQRTTRILPEELAQEGRWEHLKEWSLSYVAWTL